MNPAVFLLIALFLLALIVAVGGMGALADRRGEEAGQPLAYYRGWRKVSRACSRLAIVLVTLFAVSLFVALVVLVWGLL